MPLAPDAAQALSPAPCKTALLHDMKTCPRGAERSRRTATAAPSAVAKSGDRAAR